MLKLLRENILFCLTIGAVFLIGAAVRIQGIFGDLWLDEIWSLSLLNGVESAQDIFTRINVDNNHPLNSLYIYLLGPVSQGYYYRLFALVCGVLMLPVAALLGCRCGKLQGVFFTVLIGCSYLMVLYASEARGYAPMLLGVLLAFYCAQRYYDNHAVLWLLCFWLAVVFGFLSHFSFVHFYPALLVWSFVHFPAGTKLRAVIRRSVLVHSVPAVLFVVMYLVHIRFMPPGRGPRYSSLDVLIDALSLAAGGPEITAANLYLGALAACLALVLLVITLFEIVLLWRERNQLWMFYLMAVVASPLLFLVILPPRVIFVRYALVSIIWWYLLMAGFLVRMWQQSKTGKVVAVVLLALFLYGNGVYLALFVQHGRGGYSTALSFVARHSTAAEVTLGSDHDFRTNLLMRYYWPRVGSGKRWVEVRKADLTRQPPEWYLTHSQNRHVVPPAALNLGEQSYELVAQYPFVAQSGWAWFVYHRL